MALTRSSLVRSSLLRHLGLFKKWALPRQRGFDEQYGYYLGATDYWTHSRSSVGSAEGLDWHRNESRAATEDDGIYSAGLLAAAAVDFVLRNAQRPWFLYLPWQSVHSPLEAPQECKDRYPTLSGSQQTRAAMVSAMDDGVGNLSAALVSSGQHERTLMVFTSDNGAPFESAMWEGDEADEAYAAAAAYTGASRPPTGKGSPPHGGGGGSNAPLSGWKHWVYEGGVRSAAFVWYAPLNLKMGGSTHGGLFHATDWLPTLVRLAGGSTHANLPLDGWDIWGALEEGGSSSPRTEIPVNIAACGPDANGTRSIITGPQAAVIVGQLKLLVPCFWRSERSLTGAKLYNLSADLAEEHDLAGAMPDAVKKLGARLAYWEAQSVPPYALSGIDTSCGEGKPLGSSPPAWNPWC